MVMPPFPPPPSYIEAPAYILPQPHILPVDYRRLLQPQAHTPVVPPQNPNQTHRMRLPRYVPVRETVNFGVQTEPTQRGESGYNDGCPLNSDSGQGTASDTPSSSCSSQRRGSAEVEKYPLPHSNAEDAQVSWPLANIKTTHGFKILHPAGINAVQSSLSATQETQDRCKDDVGQEPTLIPYWSNGHCNMSTVSSPDSRAPLCSSPQREDEVVKERRISVPDILMSWGSGTPQTATLLNSLNTSHKLPGDDQEKGNETNPQEDTEVVPCQMALNCCQMRKKINESVWSVESLAPYIPTKEWLLQNGMFEPEVFDVAVETENGRLSLEIDGLIVEGKERRRARRFSSSDSQVSHNSLIFRTPAEKLSPPYRPEMEIETDISKKRGPDQDQTMTPSEKEKDLLVSPVPLSKNLSPLTEEDVDENGSSEPEANQSPNQESITVNELIVQSRTDTQVGDGAVSSEMRKEMCVPVTDQRMPEVSQSKGHLVDCGVQCSEFKCPCGESKDCMELNKRHTSKYSGNLLLELSVSFFFS